MVPCSGLAPHSWFGSKIIHGFVAHGFIVPSNVIVHIGIIAHSSLVGLKYVQDNRIVFVMLVDEDQGDLVPELQVEWWGLVLTAVPWLQDPLQRCLNEPIQLLQQGLHLRVPAGQRAVTRQCYGTGDTGQLTWGPQDAA